MKYSMDSNSYDDLLIIKIDDWINHLKKIDMAINELKEIRLICKLKKSFLSRLRLNLLVSVSNAKSKYQ